MVTKKRVPSRAVTQKRVPSRAEVWSCVVQGVEFELHLVRSTL